MNEKQLEEGSYVVYGTNGICIIEDRTLMSFISGEKKSPYYILRPVSSSESTIFVPIDNDQLMAKLRPLMTKEEIDALLLGMRGKEIQWETDRRLRSEEFHEILSKGVHQNLLLMLRCIYMRKRELTEQGKKLPTTDQNILKSAEKLVEEEFAFVLNIKAEEVSPYIRNLLQVSEDEEI